MSANYKAMLFVAGFSWVCASAYAAEPIPGIGPKGEVQKVHTGLQFTEGPAADGLGNLFFSDIPANRIYKLDENNEITVFLEPSNHTNGLMINGAGNIVACEMDGRIVEIDTRTKEVRALATGFDGKRFNAPNDLVIDAKGGVYFTDPHFRAPMPLPQGTLGVYYLDPAGKVTRLDEIEKAPNGIILSPDEKTLYVIPSLQADMLAYTVLAPGKLTERRVFCTLAQAEGQTAGGGDGLTIDKDGNLFITSRLGIQVFNPEGRALGLIEVPEQPANCTFGGDSYRTLYVTARTSLYAIPMETAGHVFPAGKK